jgi:hypothetical protein
LLDDVALGMFGGFNVADGFMDVGVERVAGVGDDFLEAELFQRAAELRLDLLQPVEQRGVVGLVFLDGDESPLEVIEHGQQRGHNALGSEPGQLLFFASDAFAVIVEFGSGAEELVPILLGLGRSGFQ